MRVGLLSDTHIPEVAEILPPEIMDAFRGVDLILHAGDIYVPSVLDTLESIAPVTAAMGDDDRGDVLMDRRVKGRHILELEGLTLLLIHERVHSPWAPWWLGNAPLEQDRHVSPDIFVFGHEHRPIVEHIDGTLFINPGSATFQNYRQGLGTVGILDIDSNKSDIHIINL